jgi:hypothetical protein
MKSDEPDRAKPFLPEPDRAGPNLVLHCQIIMYIQTREQNRNKVNRQNLLFLICNYLKKHNIYEAGCISVCQAKKH